MTISCSHRLPINTLSGSDLIKPLICFWSKRHGVDWFLQIHIGCHVKTYTVESRNDEDQICAFSQTPHNFIRRWLHIVPSTYRKRINKECDGFIYGLGSFLEKSFSSIKKKSLENYCVFRLTSSKMNDHTFLRKIFNNTNVRW